MCVGCRCKPYLQGASCRHDRLGAPQVAVEGARWPGQLDTAGLEAKGAWAAVAQLHLTHHQVVSRHKQGLCVADPDAANA